MGQSTDTELMILGGGCAGLSLAWALSNLKSDFRVVIIEPRTEYRHDRTWSFWAPSDHPLSSIISGRWTQWSFGRYGESNQRLNNPSLPYQTIESANFYQLIQNKIENAPDMQLCLGETAESFKKLGGIWQVTTNRRTMTARWVVDTRPPSHEQLLKSKMFQCFIGETLFYPGAFDPNVAELMTDMRTDEHGFVFTYVLPQSQDHALVEATRFSIRPNDWSVLEADLAKIKQSRGWIEASVTHTERAVLPMGLPIQIAQQPDLASAGTGAGGLRAASGYGFLRIQRWAEHCARTLAEEGRVTSHPREPKIQAWMDGLFLDVIRRRPEQAPELFFDMYQKLPTDVFIRFMNDQSTLVDKLKVIYSLPSSPFLRTMLTR